MAEAGFEPRSFGPEARPLTTSHSTLITFREEDPEAQMYPAGKWLMGQDMIFHIEGLCPLGAALTLGPPETPH